MRKTNEAQSKWLKNAVAKYHQALPGSPAEAHLLDRGFDLEAISRFRLGFVAEPEPGQEAYKGRLSIPYIRRSIDGNWSVLTIRFRSLEPNPKKGKYLDLPGLLGKPRLFNTLDAIDHQDRIAICEGELDAVAGSVNGIPAVGVSGATKWLPHWSLIFRGFGTVYVLADGDEAGNKFGSLVSEHVPGTRVIPMDDGEDVNSMIQKYGVDKIRERMGT